MEIERAKQYCQWGRIERVCINGPCSMHDYYWISFGGVIGNAHPTLQTGRGHEARLLKFKTLDAAAKVISEIGFRQFNVSM